MVETVDSAKLASALSSSWGKQNKQNPLNILVQVNTSEEDSKYIYFSILLLIIITIIIIIIIFLLIIIFTNHIFLMVCLSLPLTLSHCP